jgi:hypothetical protein
MDKNKLPELMRIPIDRACAVKFAKGQLEHGVEFTDDAVVACHEEFLDVMNYCDEAIKQGYDKDSVRWVRGHAISLAHKMREIYANKHGIDHALLPAKPLPTVSK